MDYVCVNDDPKHHRQTIQNYYDPAISGEYKVLNMPEPINELSTRKLILRRAAQF